MGKLTMMSMFDIVELRIGNTKKGHHDKTIENPEGEVFYTRELEVVDKYHNSLTITLHLDSDKLEIIQ